jgi:hypothetical protein
LCATQFSQQIPIVSLRTISRLVFVSATRSVTVGKNQVWFLNTVQPDFMFRIITHVYYNKSNTVKVHPRNGHEDPERKQRYTSTVSLTSALDGGEWSTPRPGRFPLGKETWYQLHRRMGEPLGRSGRVRNITGPPPPPPRTGPPPPPKKKKIKKKNK